MKKISLFLIILLMFSCKETETVAPEATIIGSWYRQITDSEGVSFNAELKFNDDNSYNFIVLDENTGHTDSYAKISVSNNIMQIIEDNDCNFLGIYEFVVTSTELALIAKEDGCSPRIVAIQGVWKRK